MFRIKQVAKSQSTHAVTLATTAPPSCSVTLDPDTDVLGAKAETGLMKGTENYVQEADTEAKVEMDTSATAPTNEMAIAVQAPEAESNLPSKTIPCDSNGSQVDTSLNEMALINSSESKIDISESENKIDPQMESVSLVETKEPELGHSDNHLLTTEILSFVETHEHVENTQMETTEQAEDIPVNINEQSENFQMDTNEHDTNSKIATPEKVEIAPAKTTEHAEESPFEGHHPLQQKDASEAGDVSVKQEEAEDSKLSDGSIAQLPIEDSETAALTGNDNVESIMEPVLKNEPQLAPKEESIQDSEVSRGNLIPESTINQNEVQFKDDLKVCEPVLIDTTLQSSDQNQSEKATTQQAALPVHDMTQDFPPVTQEILKALEAAVHQCRLQSSMKRAEEEAVQKTHAEKASAEKDVLQVDRKVPKTDRQKPIVEKGNKSQSTRTTRSQRRKTESPEKEHSSRQRVKGSPKDGSPATSNEGSSCSSTASRKTRPESSTVLKRSRERGEEGYKVRMTKNMFEASENLFLSNQFCLRYEIEMILEWHFETLICFCIDP